MTKETLAIAVALVASAEVSAAQGRPGVPPDLPGPATFQTERCVARIVVERETWEKLYGKSVEITVLIDKKHRMSVRALPRTGRGPYTLAIAPHDFLCDGKPHNVELSWKGGGPARYDVTFPLQGTQSRIFEPSGQRPAGGK